MMTKHNIQDFTVSTGKITNRNQVTTNQFSFNSNGGKCHHGFYKFEQ